VFALSLLSVVTGGGLAAARSSGWETSVSGSAGVHAVGRALPWHA
jgi:hypothetical protein